MITNSERREVAKELRRQAAYSSGSLAEWWQRLQDVALGEVDFPKPEQLFERLADLIDRPTCFNMDSEGDFLCSECRTVAEYRDIGGIGGISSLIYNEGTIEDREVRYCPNCGAEVVE